MQRKINHDDFERYLQENADEVRMSPSSAVWKNISRDLNRKRRRWFALFATLLITVSTGGYLIWNTIDQTIAENTGVPVSSKTITPPLFENNTTVAAIAPIIKPKTNQEAKKTGRIDNVRPFNPMLTAQPGTFGRAIVVPEGLAMLQDEELPVYNRLTGAVNETIALQKWNGLAKSIGDIQTGINNKAVIIPEREDSVQAEKVEVAVTKIKAKGRKLDWQLFFSPNISYRKLSENKPFSRRGILSGGTINYLGLYDVNNAVTHKPDIGFEIGITTKYSATKNTKLRAGFQFNVNRYDIKAFSYIPEVATIALNNGYSVDFVNTISNYRNFNGGKTNWLQNYYFQASIPLGAEVRVTGNDKMHVGVASTLQPTYVIGDRAYLITNDYKNYAELPWLIRRWNINTNFETFVSYSTGKTKWQVGPQVRYQLLSSFVSKYPVKENLFDFGLKVGVTLNKR